MWSTENIINSKCFLDACHHGITLQLQTIRGDALELWFLCFFFFFQCKPDKNLETGEILLFYYHYYYCVKGNIKNTFEVFSKVVMHRLELFSNGKDLELGNLSTTGHTKQ